MNLTQIEALLLDRAERELLALLAEMKKKHLSGIALERMKSIERAAQEVENARLI